MQAHDQTKSSEADTAVPGSIQIETVHDMVGGKTVIADEEDQLRLSDEDLQHELESIGIADPGRASSIETSAGDFVHRVTSAGVCPFSGRAILTQDVPPTFDSHATTEQYAFRYVPLRMSGARGKTHRPSSGSRALIGSEITFEDLLRMTNTFYTLAFEDDTLDKFIRSHSDPHGTRFAKWIHQKLSGSTLWDDDRVHHRDTETPHPIAGGHRIIVHDRTSAHVAAWYSPKRSARDVGRHFTLEECRVWMRLHFWAMRLSGVVHKSPSFADYYVRFIAHFVAVYERTAPQFARDSFRWSADRNNIEKYLADGRMMKDVLGISFADAVGQVPQEEIDDDEWPYDPSPDNR